MAGVCVLIAVIMGMWSELNACVVSHVVRVYSVVDIVGMSGDGDCYVALLGGGGGGGVFSMMYSRLQTMSEIS